MASIVEARDLQLGEVYKPFKDSQIQDGTISGESLPFGGRQIGIRASMEGLKGSLISLGISVERPLTPDELKKLGQHKVNVVIGQERVEIDIIPGNGLPQAKGPWTIDELKDAEVIVYQRHQTGS